MSSALFTRRKVFVRDFTGLGNRLEAAALALVLAARDGREVCLDWPELDGFSIAGTRRAKLRFWHRPGRGKLFDCQSGLPDWTAVRAVVDIRGIYGPRDLQRAQAAELASRIAPTPATAASVRSIFVGCEAVPVVAVHIRRGDFTVPDGTVFQPSVSGHLAPPIWWYRDVMRVILDVRPDTRFFVAYNGGREVIEELGNEFPLITSGQLCGYANQPPGHRSLTDPVVDLFALACCRVVIATPRSSFSHWAANWLGKPALVLLPMGESTAGHPGIGAGSFQGVDLPSWNAMSGSESRLAPLDADVLRSHLLPPELDWWSRQDSRLDAEDDHGG